MTSRTGTGNAKFIRIDTKRPGPASDKAHGPVYIGSNFLYCKAWLRTVHHVKNGITPPGERLPGPDPFMSRLPAATDDADDAQPIGLSGFDYIHCQGDAIVAGINQVPGAGGGQFLRVGEGRQSRKQQDNPYTLLHHVKSVRIKT
jgi:hypothetical protein